MGRDIIRKAIESSAADITDSVFKGVSSEQSEEFKSFLREIMGKICESVLVSPNSAWLDSSKDSGWLRKAADPDLKGVPREKLLDLYELAGIGPEQLAKMLANQMKQKPELAQEVSRIVGLPMGREEIAPMELTKGEPFPPEAIPKPPAPKPPPKPEMGPRPKRMEPKLSDPTEIVPPSDEFSTERPSESTPGAE
jgi:hypothetical protein